MNTLIIDNLTVRYGKYEALHGVSGKFLPGITGVLGPNGAGKTTLFRAISTLLPIAGGQISLNGASKPADIRRMLGYVPQKFGSYPYLTVYETLEQFAVLRGIPGKESKKAVNEAMNRTHLTELCGKRIGTLSGGMLRRVGIAQAILAHPPLLLIDEPTAGLDPEECARFRSLIRALSSEHILIFSTHILDDISVCDRLSVVHEGRLCQFDSPQALALLAEGHVRTQRVDKEAYLRISEEKLMISSVAEDDHFLVRYLEESAEEGMPSPLPEDGYIWLIHH